MRHLAAEALGVLVVIGSIAVAAHRWRAHRRRRARVLAPPSADCARFPDWRVHAPPPQPRR